MFSGKDKKESYVSPRLCASVAENQELRMFAGVKMTRIAHSEFTSAKAPETRDSEHGSESPAKWLKWA